MKLRIDQMTYDILTVIDLGQLQTGEKRIKITLSVKTDDVSSMMAVFADLPDTIRIEEDDTFALIRQLEGYRKAYDFQYSSDSEILSVIVQEDSALDKIEEVRTALSALQQKVNLMQSQISNIEENISSMK